MDNNGIAVLVGSCDAYSDIWKYFFFFIDRHWSNCPYQFYLLSEELSYDWICPSGRKLIMINTDKGLPWSERVLYALKFIEEDYVIFILDDSFVLDSVRQSTIETCKLKFDNDNTIGCFHLEELIPNPYHMSCDESGFRQMDKREPFLASAYVTIWRKKFLRKLLRKEENPWQFELYATERCRHYKEKIYILGENSPSVIHYYIKGKGGYGISGGKWAPNTVNLFNKYSLKCDFSQRGFYDIEQIYINERKPRNPRLSLFQKIFLPITDYSLFKEKMDPRIRVFKAKVDLKGRFFNLIS